MRPIEKGDRFEDLDERNEGRIIEIDEVLPDGRFLARTEVHPRNPGAVGKARPISADTLLSRYARQSR